MRKTTTSRKGPRTPKLLLVEADGTRRDVTGASGFVIKTGRTEVEVSPEVVRVVEGSIARVRTNGPLLVLGPGDGTSVSLGVVPSPPRSKRGRKGTVRRR